MRTDTGTLATTHGQHVMLGPLDNSKEITARVIGLQQSTEQSTHYLQGSISYNGPLSSVAFFIGNTLLYSHTLYSDHGGTNVVSAQMYVPVAGLTPLEQLAMASDDKEDGLQSVDIVITRLTGKLDDSRDTSDISLTFSARKIA